MRIKALRIDRYGPLSDFSRTHVGDFTVVYGTNERGKTLIIDALIKMLFRKEFSKLARHFGNIQRVTEAPEGFLVLESKGSQIKIEGDMSVTDYLPVDAQAFRNIFIVRDSDIGIVEEAKFYAELSERLAGLKTSEITRIKRILQQKGRLTNPTAKSDLSKAAAADHAGRRVETARALIEEIEGKVTVFINSDYDRLERRLVESKDQITQMQTELGVLKNAQTREKYNTCEKNLEELERCVNKLRHLSNINDDGMEQWKQLDFERGRLGADIEAAEDQRLRDEERLQQINEDYAHVRARVTELEEQHRQVEEGLKPEMQKCLELMRTSRRHRARASMWRIGALAALGLLAISMVGSVIHPSMFFYGASVVFLGALALSVSRLIRLRRTEWRVREDMEEIRRLAKRFDLNIETSEDLMNMQNPFERELAAEQVKLHELDIACRALGSQQLSFSQKTGRQRERLLEVQDQIKNFALQSGTANIEAYRVSLDTQRELKARVNTLYALLTNELGEAKSEVMIDVWNKALDEKLAAIPDDGGGIPYDVARVRMLQREIEKTNVQVEETNQALNLGRRELRDLELKLTQSGIFSDNLVVCRTTKDLEALAVELREFIGEIERQVQDAKAAIRLFELIEVEEKSRLIELFGSGRPVSSYFKMMTDGLYEEVCFDIATNEITVLTADNSLLPVNRLSGGALDQLYLAIRISIAERLMSEPGFFILDDPFIKADIHRVATQMNVLKLIVQTGWQILYISAKKAVDDVLSPDIESGQVELVQLREPLSRAPQPARAPATPEGPADLFSTE